MKPLKCSNCGLPISKDSLGEWAHRGLYWFCSAATGNKARFNKHEKAEFDAWKWFYDKM